MTNTRYWLMKSEPDVYSIDHLKAEGETPWEGVRNYQARNFMKNDMRLGDRVLFYHSNTKPPGIVGLGEVSKLAYPDYFAWDIDSKYFDPKSTEDNPRWWMVNVSFVAKFSSIISLDDIRNHSNLQNMMVIRKGSRLSIQPVEKEDYDTLLRDFTDFTS